MNIEDTCKHTKIRLIAAAIAHQQCTQTAGAEVQITGTDKRILIGDDEYLAKVAAPAEAPSQVPAELTDERIDQMARDHSLDGSMLNKPRYAYWRMFARAIEREVRLSAVREARNEAQWISVDDERKPEVGKSVLMFVRTIKHGEDDEGRPYDTEGAEVAMGEYRKSPGYDVCYFDCYTSPMSDNDWITHWMPLPAAPAASKEGGEHA
jgi:hypothetical protein